MNQHWKRTECVTTQVEDQLVVLHLETLVYHSLNGTAAAIWGLLDQPRTTDDLAEALGERYAVSQEQARLAVERLLHQWEKSKLVQQVGEQAATS